MTDKIFQQFASEITTSLLIDGDSLHPIQQRLNWLIDLEKLRDLLREYYFMPRLVYFETLQPTANEKLLTFHKWLQYRGFEVITRPKTKRGQISSPDGNGPPIPAPDTSPIPCDIVAEAAFSAEHCHHIILLSRNRDLEAIGLHLRRTHRALTLLCDGDCPSDLRRSAGHFVDLNHIKPYVCRPYASGRA
jgi:uncharacterized LabA/DUF88 family protein